MADITEYEHHGNKVKVMEGLKGHHRAHCLCFQGCKHFKPEDRPNNCHIARVVYSTCVTYGIVTPVWECPKFSK